MNQGVLITIGIILFAFAIVMWYSLREKYEFKIEQHGGFFIVYMRLGPFGKWEKESHHVIRHNADLRIEELDKFYNRIC